MGRIRTYRRGGSWLALVALLLQIVLSFGHVHGLGAFGAAHGGDALAAATSPSEPPGSDPDGDRDGHHDVCAICATLALVQGGLAATPPALPLPNVFSSSKQSCGTRAATPAGLTTSAFQPRAPPAA